MKIAIVGALLALISGSTAFAGAEHLAALPPGVELGVYDIVGSFRKVPTIAYEHVWYRWDRPIDLSARLNVVTARDRNPLLTVEPYGPGNLLGDIAAGGYDSLITDIAQQVAALKTTVIVRFAPEMDHVSRVPWSLKEPSAYIAAYRHFVTKFRSIAPNSRQCWSPVGDKGLEVYYPGDDVVDYTGFSIYEIPECSTTWVGHPQSFADWMNDKYPLLARFGKPIILTEVGVVSTTDQKAWIRSAFASIGSYPLVKVFVYYNATDPVSWARWGGPKKPSWVINPALFKN